MKEKSARISEIMAKDFLKQFRLIYVFPFSSLSHFFALFSIFFCLVYILSMLCDISPRQNLVFWSLPKIGELANLPTLPYT